MTAIPVEHGIRLRGDGESDWAADGDYLLDAYARDVEAPIDGFDEPVMPVVLVAHGVGHMFAGDRNDAFAETLLDHLSYLAPVPA
jgi:hypothetical protein